MYSEYVTIIVDGKQIAINTCCMPDMPIERKKVLAIAQYMHSLKNQLYIENGIPNNPLR